MDTRTFTELLASTPEVRLKLLDLLNEFTRPDGSLDMDAAASRQSDIDMARVEAAEYATTTKRLSTKLWNRDHLLR